MPRLTPDAGDELIRVIRGNFANFGCGLTIEALERRNWASVTFSGERHRLELRLQGEDAGAAADAFLPGLAEREFDLRGHILADIAVISEERDEEGGWARLSLEALTLESS